MREKLNKMLIPVTFITAAFVLVCYINFTFSSIMLGAGAREVTIGLVVCAAAAAVVLLRNKLPKAISWICCAGMLFYMISYTIFAFTILAPNESEIAMAVNNEDESHVIIIFGCRAFGLEPGNQLKERLDRALELIDELPDAKIIVSGGQGANETAPEAEAMRAYLIAHGADEDNIYTESNSSSTEKNIRYSIELMQQNGLPETNVTAVSSYYHLPRIRLLAEREGLTVTTVGSGSGGVLRFFSADLVREYMAFVKLLIRSVV